MGGIALSCGGALFLKIFSIWLDSLSISIDRIDNSRGRFYWRSL